MARQSAEDRSAAEFRAGSAPPPPPKHLTREATALWVRIAASKPADWFDSAAQVLLAQYCETAVHAVAMAAQVARLREAGAWTELEPLARRWLRAVGSLGTLATKLRLTVQARVDRRSRGLLERGTGSHPLLGLRARNGGRKAD